MCVYTCFYVYVFMFAVGPSWRQCYMTMVPSRLYIQVYPNVMVELLVHRYNRLLRVVYTTLQIFMCICACSLLPIQIPSIMFESWGVRSCTQACGPPKHPHLDVRICTPEFILVHSCTRMHAPVCGQGTSTLVGSMHVSVPRVWGNMHVCMWVYLPKSMHAHTTISHSMIMAYKNRRQRHIDKERGCRRGLERATVDHFSACVCNFSRNIAFVPVRPSRAGAMFLCSHCRRAAIWSVVGVPFSETLRIGVRAELPCRFGHFWNQSARAPRLGPMIGVLESVRLDLPAILLVKCSSEASTRWMPRAVVVVKMLWPAVSCQSCRCSASHRSMHICGLTGKAGFPPFCVTWPHRTRGRLPLERPAGLIKPTKKVFFVAL